MDGFGTLRAELDAALATKKRPTPTTENAAPNETPAPAQTQKARRPRTAFNAHAKEFLQREVSSRIAEYKRSSPDEKKAIEKEVWRLARGDEACEADGWTAGAVANWFHNFKGPGKA